MPPAKGNVCESMILDYEREELSPAQETFYNSINEKIAAYEQKMEEISKRKDVQIDSQGEITLVEFQALQLQVNTAQLIGGKRVLLQPNPQNVVMVDEKGLSVLLSNSPAPGTVATTTPHTTISSPVSVTPAIRVQTPPALNNIRTPRIRVRGGLSGPSSIRGGGTAFRQRAPGFIRGAGPRFSPVISPRGGFLLSQLKTTPIAPAAEKKNVVVDLTDEDQGDDMFDVSASKADSKEVSISKNSEKTFPSLVVMARPFLGPKSYSNATINLERNALDDRVKQILGLGPSTVTEWLLQHGLLRSEQTCNAYGGRGKTHLPLKLGMYSDSTKFPFSGGYVWISECCPSQFVSVFSGSLFEAVPHPPSVLIKLIYHWSCQTAVQNIIQWVKVDNLFVKTLFTNLRAVCTAAIHQKFPVFGGAGKKVQIGVISLGTTTHDGSSRQVKVEVLGILEDETKMIRIRAIDPIPPDSSLNQQEQMKKRFQKTLDLLPKWVDKATEITIDYTVDKQTLHSFGFLKVIQIGPNDQNYNYKIMDYLRKIIPRMFQNMPIGIRSEIGTRRGVEAMPVSNEPKIVCPGPRQSPCYLLWPVEYENTLSLLSRQIIQQFLDELSWRESFGPIPSRAFQTIVEHISEQTRLNTGGTLLNRLSRISLNPFKNWAYDRWNANCKYLSSSSSSSSNNKFQSSIAPKSPVVAVAASPQVSRKTPGPACSQGDQAVKNEPTISGIKKSDLSDPTMIALEPYYYGVLDGLKKNKYVPFFTQCYFCRADFKNVLKLTDHLILHALNKNLENTSDPKDICRACLKIRLPGSKQHHQQLCKNGPLTLGCRICALKMKDKGSLVYHMTKTHHQLDMPYLCGKCGYRVSEYDLLNQHFTKVHHNGVTGMCPFCLKVIDFATEEGGDLEQNQVFFTKHIQRHALPSSKKCSRCLLNFVNKSILAAHEVEMHASQEENSEVMRFLVDSPTLMPAPIMEPSLVHAIQPGDLKPTGLLKGISTVLLGVQANVDEGLGINCHECESPVIADHFINYLMCNKCSFRTCCAHAMAEHVSLLHPPYPLSSPVYVGMKTTIQDKMHCYQCAFTSRDGNTMSQHLVTCGSGSCNIGRKRPLRPESEPLALQPKLRKKRGRKSKTWVADLSEQDHLDDSSQAPPKNVLASIGLMRKSTEDDASQEQGGSSEEPTSGLGSIEDVEKDEDIIDPSVSLLEVSMEEGASGVDTGPDIIPVGAPDSSDSDTQAEPMAVD